MRTLRRALPLLALLTVSSAALAKDDKAEKKTAGPKAISDYDQAIVDAHKAFQAGLAGNAIDEAITGYRKAIAIDPNRPEGHLYLGGALYQKADWGGAEEALTNAANRAKADKSYTNFLGKALFLTATVKEAQAKTEEAKTAWKAYEDFAKENPDANYPEGSGNAPPMAVKVFAGSAAERQTKLETYSKMVVDYAKVKELILKRQKELGIEPTPAKPTTPAK